MRIYKSIDETVGRTPLVEFVNTEKAFGLGAKLLAKLEYFNPAGSSKDRIAVKIINDAEADGRLKPGATVIEPTSGNTGIGLCMVAAARGYKAIIVMPDSMSVERIKLMKGYGAEVILTDGRLGMAGAIAEAERIAATLPGSFIAGQFTNGSNPAAHYDTTGPEIWEDTDGHADIFVASVGTGGTITGTGRYLKEKNPEIRVVGVEPAGSAVLSGGSAGSHKIQGIGAGFIPEVLDTSVYDEIIAVTDEDAFRYARMGGINEGALIGISSGAVLCAAVELAGRQENAGKNIVMLMPDGGSRYLSGELFDF